MIQKKDFTATNFKENKENLVINIEKEIFYLVDEIEYDTSNSEDILKCEVLYSNEEIRTVKYFKHKPAIYEYLKRKEIKSVPLRMN